MRCSEKTISLVKSTFSRADFVFDLGRNVYICPGGKLLHTTATVIDGGTLRYRASKIDQPINWPRAEEASRAVRKYLTALDAAQNRAENSEEAVLLDCARCGRARPVADKAFRFVHI